MSSTDQGYGYWNDALPETYTELTRELAPQSRIVNDKTFIEATTEVIDGLNCTGDVVIIGRGANMILAGVPGVVHIGIMAPLQTRIETMMRRERFTREEARSYVEELEEARIDFFRKFFKVHPYEVSLYHMALNTGEIGVETAAKVIVHAVEDLAP